VDPPSKDPYDLSSRSIISEVNFDFFLFNSNNYTIYPSDMDNKYIHFFLIERA
jgi:hypothetical protein